MDAGSFIVMCVVFALPSRASAGRADCAAVQAAVVLQSKTPFHAVITKAPTKAGAFPTSADEAIWAGNTFYMKLSSSWLKTPMTADGVLQGVTGGIAHFSGCRRLADEVIRGEATAVYAAKMESGEQAQLWISAKTGLLLREVVDEDIMKVTAEFDYANVHAPAT